MDNTETQAIKTYISNVVRMTRFWNKLHQIHSKSNDGKAKYTEQPQTKHKIQHRKQKYIRNTDPTKTQELNPGAPEG